MTKLEGTQNYTMSYENRSFFLEYRKEELCFKYFLYEIVESERKFIDKFITSYCCVEEIFNNILD